MYSDPKPHTYIVVQAKAVWQLFNYAENLATMRGRTLLRVNLDETAVCLHPGQGKGAIFVTKGVTARWLWSTRPEVEATLLHDTHWHCV